MTRPMPEPPEKYQLLGPMVIVWEGGNGYYYHPSLMDDKRLTDAECAAEYWRALCDTEEAMTRQEVMDFIVKRRSERKDNGAISAQIRRNASDANTWHRFATRPHALEEA